MASQWSGLAPAVNAHLDRWQRSDKEWQKVQRHFERELKKGVATPSMAMTPEQYPIAYTWSVFARTWGLPTPEGGVITPERVPMEGMTINGREQFVSTPASDKNGLALLEREHKMLHRAETVYVSGEIVDRIT